MSSTSHPTPLVEPPRKEDVRISDNAVVRYRERVRPGLDDSRARAELERLVLEHGEVRSSAPFWVRDGMAREFFVVVGESAVLPLAHDATGNWAATTCIPPGSPTAKQRRAREHRNARRNRKPKR